MTLKEAEVGKEYTIRQTNITDEELSAFLFSLGCFSGEPIAIVRRLTGGCIVAIKDGRYCIDNQLAQSIIV